MVCVLCVDSPTDRLLMLCWAALSRWYATMAEGAKAMVWDAEKMDVIVTACQADLFKLKMDGNQTKTRMNQMRCIDTLTFACQSSGPDSLAHVDRMFGKAKVYGMQLWMDYVKREKYLRLKEALDQANRRLKDLGQELVNYETVCASEGDLSIALIFLCLGLTTGGRIACEKVPRTDQREVAGRTHEKGDEFAVVSGLPAVASVLASDPSRGHCRKGAADEGRSE